MKLCCLIPPRTSIMIKLLIIVSFSFMTTLSQAQIFDSYSIEAGKGVHASIYKLGAQKLIGQDNAFLNKYNLRPYVEFSIASINARRYQDMDGQSKSFTNFGITPVLRWQQNRDYGIYAEIGLGINYMSDYYNNAGKVASTRYQFGDQIGLGYKFSNSVDVSLKFQHYSNAGIKEPNPAINFTTIKLAYSF